MVRFMKLNDDPSREVRTLWKKWEDILDNRELSKDLVSLINNTVIALKYLEKLLRI